MEQYNRCECSHVGVDILHQALALDSTKIFQRIIPIGSNVYHPSETPPNVMHDG